MNKEDIIHDMKLIADLERDITQRVRDQEDAQLELSSKCADFRARVNILLDKIYDCLDNGVLKND